MIGTEVGLQSRPTILPVRGGQKNFERAGGPEVGWLSDWVWPQEEEDDSL